MSHAGHLICPDPVLAWLGVGGRMRLIRHTFAAVALMLPAMLGAQSTPSAIPNLNVVDLCQFMAEGVREIDPAKGTKYAYQTLLYAAAGVDPHKDDAATRSAKMQAWWNRYQDRLICNVPHSIVRNGSILKLAVDRSGTDFIDDAVRRWKVDLNHIDADGTTVLDFIAKEREEARNTPRFQILDAYYNTFASKGAKRARELR